MDRFIAAAHEPTLVSISDEELNKNAMFVAMGIAFSHYLFTKRNINYKREIKFSIAEFNHFIESYEVKRDKNTGDTYDWIVEYHKLIARDAGGAELDLGKAPI